VGTTGSRPFRKEKLLSSLVLRRRGRKFARRRKETGGKREILAMI